MGGASFRMFFGDRPATVEELARIEAITVEQEMEMAWEARVRMSLCLDDQGRWQHGTESLAQPFSRIRIEVKLGDRDFAPLIDGPVAGFAADMSGTPGRSVAQIVVRDDSVLLNRKEKTEVFENRRDSDLADEMFGNCPTITERQIKQTDAVPPTTVRRGTEMQFIRELARANGFLGYVLPGRDPGKSIGCFEPPETGAPAYPPLKLIGADRSLSAATFTDDSEGPETTTARTLRFSDRQVVGASRSVSDETLLGALPQVGSDASALRELPPQENRREEPEAAAAAQARRESYALKMTGSVVPGCYDAVLAPYRTVAIHAGDTPYSGVWLIHKVRHVINPSVYTQEIEAKRNALSDAGSGPLGLVAGVF